MIRALARQKQRELKLLFRRHSSRVTRLPCFLKVLLACPCAGAQHLVRHVRVRVSGRQAVDLNVVVSDFRGERLCQSDHASLRCGVR